MAENMAEDPIYKFLRRRGVDDGVMKNMKDEKVLPYWTPENVATGLADGQNIRDSAHKLTQ